MASPVASEITTEIPPGILHSRAALLRELPALLSNAKSRGKWACYSGDAQIGIGPDYLALIRECVRRGIPDDEYVIERIVAGAGSEDEEEIESRHG